MELEITPQTRVVWVIKFTKPNGEVIQEEFHSKSVAETLCDFLEYNKIDFKVSLKLSS